MRRGLLGRAISVNGVPIRLTEERWEHIVNKHADLLNYQQDILAVVENPEAIYRGRRGVLIAICGYGRRGFLAVASRSLLRKPLLSGDFSARWIYYHCKIYSTTSRRCFSMAHAGIRTIDKLKQLYDVIQDSPSGKLFVDYDKEADVLYVTFTENAAIYMSDLTDDDILLEYDKDGHLVGVTILDVSRDKII